MARVPFSTPPLPIEFLTDSELVPDLLNGWLPLYTILGIYKANYKGNAKVFGI